MVVTQEERLGPGHHRAQKRVALTPFAGEFRGPVDNRVDLAVQLPLWFQESVGHSPKGHPMTNTSISLAAFC